MATSSSNTITTSRRPTTEPARDWASLPPPLLQKVFRSLEVSDLPSAKATCRQWKAEAYNLGGGVAALAHNYDRWITALPQSVSIDIILQRFLEILEQGHTVAVGAGPQSDAQEDLEGPSM